MSETKQDPTEAEMRRRRRDGHITSFMRLRAINMLDGAAIIASDDASRTSKEDFLRMAGESYDRARLEAEFMRLEVLREDNPPNLSSKDGILPDCDSDDQTEVVSCTKTPPED